MRVLLVLDFSSRSMPRLSPTAPSSVSKAVANALINSRRSRRIGSPMRVCRVAGNEWKSARSRPLLPLMSGISRPEFPAIAAISGIPRLVGTWPPAVFVAIDIGVVGLKGAEVRSTDVSGGGIDLAATCEVKIRH